MMARRLEGCDGGNRLSRGRRSRTSSKRRRRLHALASKIPARPPVRKMADRRLAVAFHEARLLWSTVMTTFPRACPVPRYRIASAVSRNGYRRSITGTTLPFAMRSLR